MRIEIFRNTKRLSDKPLLALRLSIDQYGGEAVARHLLL